MDTVIQPSFELPGVLIYAQEIEFESIVEP